MNSIFADTFYFAALSNAKDQAHQRVVEFATRCTDPIITTSWVIMEFADGMCKSSNRAIFLKLYEILHNDPQVHIIPLDQLLMDRGYLLYQSRSDKDWSLTDCISFVVMQEQGITAALTGDHHFEQTGFTALLK